MCHVSCVMCHVSRVTCHMSPVTCHLSHVTCHKKIGQSGEASRWRVCYQRGLPRLVFMMIDYNGDTEYAIIETVLLRTFCKLGLAFHIFSKIKV